MHTESNSEGRGRLKEAVGESQAAEALARPTPASLPPGLLLTIPEAARHLRIAERAVRLALAEPDLNARLVERTRKVGIYYKFIPLLPPDLVASLENRFTGPKG